MEDSKAILQLIGVNTSNIQSQTALLQKVLDTTSGTKATVDAMHDSIRDIRQRLEEVEDQLESFPPPSRVKQSGRTLWDMAMAAGILLAFLAGATEMSCSTRKDVPPVTPPRIYAPADVGGPYSEN